MDEIPASATLRRGDDYVRGADVYRHKCASVMVLKALARWQTRVIYPALAGPESFSLDSRMNFASMNTVMPVSFAATCRWARKVALIINNAGTLRITSVRLPRPAGDRQGPLVAAWQQVMMTVMPPLTRYAEALARHEHIRD